MHGTGVCACAHNADVRVHGADVRVGARAPARCRCACAGVRVASVVHHEICMLKYFLFSHLLC